MSFSFGLCFSIAHEVEAAGSDQWYLELRDDSVDGAVARRAIGLELREVDIPGDPGRELDEPGDVSLFVKVERSDKKLFVSLWDRGEFVGKRRVSDSGHPRLKARRVGLATAQLARSLRARRIRLERRMRQELAEEEKRSLSLATAKTEGDLGLNSGVQSLWITQGAFSLGPALGLDFKDYHPVRFTTQLAWLSGSVPALSSSILGDNAPPFSQLDLSVGTAYVVEKSSSTRMDFGGILAVSFLHFGGAVEVDGLSGIRDTWSARAGLRFGASQRLSEHAWGRVGLTAGSVLRRMPLARGDQRENLGGGFVGASLAVALAP